MNLVVGLTPPLLFLLRGLQLVRKHQAVTGRWVICAALALELDAAYALRIH